MGKLYRMGDMRNAAYYITDFDTSLSAKCASDDKVTLYTSTTTGNGSCHVYVATTGGTRIVNYDMFEKRNSTVNNFKFSNVNIFLGKNSSSSGKVLLSTLSTSMSGMGYSPKILTDSTGINNWIDTHGNSNKTFKVTGVTSSVMTLSNKYTGVFGNNNVEIAGPRNRFSQDTETGMLLAGSIPSPIQLCTITSSNTFLANTTTCKISSALKLNYNNTGYSWNFLYYIPSYTWQVAPTQGEGEFDIAFRINTSTNKLEYGIISTNAYTYYDAEDYLTKSAVGYTVTYTGNIYIPNISVRGDI